MRDWVMAIRLRYRKQARGMTPEELEWLKGHALRVRVGPAGSLVRRRGQWYWFQPQEQEPPRFRYVEPLEAAELVKADTPADLLDIMRRAQSESDLLNRGLRWSPQT